MKKVISMLLAFSLCLSLTISAFAEGETISGREIMELLDTFVSENVPDSVSQWKETCSRLRKSSKPVNRLEAMAALYLAAHTIGQGNVSYDPFAEASALNMNWDLDYLDWDLFGGFEANSSYNIGAGDNMPLDGAAYNYNLGRDYEGEHPFSIDPVSNSVRAGELATYEEVVTAISRVENASVFGFEGRTFSKTAVQAQAPRYVSIDEVGGYNELIITPELLKDTSGVDKANLPYWTGYILENKIFANQYYTDAWENYNAGGKYFCEEEIRYLAMNGFNCARVCYSFSFLSNPDDVYSINVSELEQLDELISWGLKYNIHIMLSITGLPGMWGVDTAEENVGSNNAIFHDAEVEKAFARYWKMLSVRYANIPSDVLSFELMAEPQQADNNQDEAYNLQRYYDVLAPIANSLWEDYADRIIIVMDLAKNVPYQLAEIGCCLSLHTHIYMTDARRLEEGYGIKTATSWPMQYMPCIFSGDTLTLLSDEGFEDSTFRVYLEWHYGDPPVLQIDGAVNLMQEGTNDHGVFYWEGNVPAGAHDISLIFPFGAGGGLLQAEVVGAERAIYLPTTGWAQAFHGDDPLPTIKVEADGSLTCLSGEAVDADYVFNTYIKPFTDCAAENGVSFIMTEVANDTLSLSPEEYVEYNRIWLETLKENRIGWMYNCVHNIFGPRALIWHNGAPGGIPFANFSQWEDTCYAINDDIMNLLKEYQ